MNIKEKLQELNDIDKGYYWWALEVFEVPDTYINDIEGAVLYIKNNYTEELINKKFKELDSSIKEYEEKYEN